MKEEKIIKIKGESNVTAILTRVKKVICA